MPHPNWRFTIRKGCSTFERTDALRDSISRSINYYYYKLAYDMGIDRLAEYMHRYGFGEPTGIDLTGESAGIVPSREW